MSSTRPALRRIHPSVVDPIGVREAYTVDRPRLPDRPWIGLCMVTSLDGTVSVDGRSGGLGNANDLEVLLTLRSLADVVLVGAGTVRDEGYGAPRRPGQRVGVVTRSGRVDLDGPLFTSGSGFLIAPHDAPIDEDRVDVLRAGRGLVDLGEAVRRLHEVVPGVLHVQAEGGPVLNAALLSNDLIDELNLTLASRLSGGPGRRLAHEAPEIDRRFDLAHLLVDDDGFVFGRWTRRR
ncbi:MAG: dihydrofolate reductase family protein [Ilumatobacteraceae bacterium]